MTDEILIPDNRGGDLPSRRRLSLLEVLVYFLLIAIAVVCFGILLTDDAAGQTPTTTPVQFFRDTVYRNDGDRDWTCVWVRGDYKQPTEFGFFKAGDEIWDSVSLIDNTGQRWNVDNYTLRHQTWLESCHYRCFKVPTSVPLGTYAVVLNGKEQSKLTVASRKQYYTTLAPGRMLGLKTERDRAYYGYQTTITGGTVFIQPGSALHGLTMIDCNVFGMAGNCVFKDCKFIRCIVGGMSIACDESGKWIGDNSYQDHGALYQNCLFDQSCVSGCCSGCFFNCTWTGRMAAKTNNAMNGQNQHAFVCERAKRLVMINCLFDRTDRGPVLRTIWGDSSDNLYVGLSFRDIYSHQDTNADELLCCEGLHGRFDRNMVFSPLANNCRHSIQLWDCNATGTLIANGLGTRIRVSGLGQQDWTWVRYCTMPEPVEMNKHGSGATNTQLIENTVKP